MEQLGSGSNSRMKTGMGWNKVIEKLKNGMKSLLV